MNDIQWLWLLPALPLVGSALCGVLHLATLRARATDPEAKGPSGLAHPIACLAMAGAFAVSLAAFFQLMGGDPHGGHGGHGTSFTSLESSAWSWIDAGSVQIAISMVVDRLSSVMILVVTGVGLLIHIYAGGYMKGDAGFAKFFCYLNLFVFAMLMLVLSSSLLGLFIGWEGVGLCSYLLIGFWYTQKWPREASQKAFVVNRIGDAFFLIGSFLLVGVFGSLDMSDIGASVAGLLESGEHNTQLTLAALCLFAGACGKSAQIPLFVWLPDAMAGPTPVSALIHAATMVTSGIYLVVRLNPLFAANQGVLLAVGIVAALTAFVAGTSALRQRDIKGVLAYSTVSQLGYMFLGLSAGAWTAAIFHLVTHAFFKALLFLGAGSVIHGMHGEQDMHKMGNLREHMPWTYRTFVVGAAALSGLPLLAGFWSKDEILALNFAKGGAWYALWAVGIVTAAITAYYSWRMVALTFHGEERFDAKEVHPHEGGAVMNVPLILLAVLAALGGAIGLPHVLHVPHLLHEWLHPVTEVGEAVLVQTTGHGSAHLSVTTEWILLGLGSLIALVFSFLGFRHHASGIAKDEAIAAKNPALAGLFANAWGLDSAFNRGVVGPVKAIAMAVSVAIDSFAIDGLVNGAANSAKDIGSKLRAMADGRVSHYALWMGGGAATIAFLWIWSA